MYLPGHFVTEKVKNLPEKIFGMVFYLLFSGILVSGSLNRKYLAYIALLAGWLIFCYWLYAKEIYPRLHRSEGLRWPVFDEELDLPLAFHWGSDIPHAGKGFDEWARELKHIDSARNFLIFRSYYYRDEAGTIRKGKELGRKRVERIVQYLELSKERTMIEVIPGDISADVRSHPFEAIQYETLIYGDLVSSTTDTMEICFPVKDSFTLPQQLLKTLDEWLAVNSDKKGDAIYLTGTADGTGISESADVAWDRALVIKKRLLYNGCNEKLINIITGQRNHPHAIRNRCVVIYFE